MGILASKHQKAVTSTTKRRSTQLDFSNLAPLKPGGTVGFSSFRDNDGLTRGNKSRKKSNGSTGGAGAMDEDSEDDDDDAEIVGKMEDVEDKGVKTMLSPEDAKFQGELADGVRQIKVSILLIPHSLWISADSRNSSSANTLLSHSTLIPASRLHLLAVHQ
jgi:hypothetical protein